MVDTIHDGDEKGLGREHMHEGGGRERMEIQAPPTLLPNVLHHLGLVGEQGEVSSEIAVDDVMMNLRSDDWQKRITAVRTLGKLGERLPVELLDEALDDEDSSVRAAAVHVLGCAGKRPPLPRLVTALHDTDWHVREVAVLVLGNWQQDIPSEELNSALYDEDGLVRQAARLILHDKKIETDSYGRLWEQENMQQEQESPLQKGQGRDSFETLFDARRQESGEGHEYTHALHEQSQAYAPQETFAYEHAGPMSQQWEKVTNLPTRKSQKGWWAVVAGTAIIFFLLGSGVTHTMGSSAKFMGPMGPVISSKEVGPRPENFILARSPYAQLMQSEVSSALQLSPDSIRGQLNEGKQLSDIAASQGISQDQLQKIELQAINDADNAAFKSDDGQAQKFIDQLKGNPQAMDKIITEAFLTNN